MTKWMKKSTSNQNFFHIFDKFERIVILTNDYTCTIEIIRKEFNSNYWDSKMNSICIFMRVMHWEKADVSSIKIDKSWYSVHNFEFE